MLYVDNEKYGTQNPLYILYVNWQSVSDVWQPGSPELCPQHILRMNFSALVSKTEY